MNNQEENSKNELGLWIEFQKRDPGGVITRFFPLLLMRDDLKNQGLSGDQYKEKIGAAFIATLQAWYGEKPDYIFTFSDYYWLIDITTHIGLDHGMGVKFLNWMLNHHEQDVLDNADKIREKGDFPSSLTKGINPLPERENITVEQINALYLALLLSPQKITFPPGHEYWKALGVNNAGEWKQLGPRRALILFDNFERVSRVYLKAADKTYKNKGMRSRNRVNYGHDLTGIDTESREAFNEYDEVETKLLYEQVCKTVNDKTDQLCLAVYLEGTKATLKEAYQRNIKACQEAGLNSPEAITMRIKRLRDRYPL